MPSGLVLEQPPLPAPRTPPLSPSQDLLDIARPLDQEMGSCENEEELEWQPVRRFTHLDRRNKLGVIKGFTKQRHEKRLPACKHVTLEDDELTENTGNDLQSGKEIADMLCNMRHEKLLEVVQIVPRACCRSLRRTFLLRLRQRLFQYQQVPVGGASRLRGGNQAKKACSF